MAGVGNVLFGEVTMTHYVANGVVAEAPCFGVTYQDVVRGAPVKITDTATGTTRAVSTVGAVKEAINRDACVATFRRARRAQREGLSHHGWHHRARGRAAWQVSGDPLDSFPRRDIIRSAVRYEARASRRSGRARCDTASCAALRRNWRFGAPARWPRLRGRDQRVQVVRTGDIDMTVGGSNRAKRLAHVEARDFAPVAEAAGNEERGA